VLVHADPQPSGSADHHAMLASHRRNETLAQRALPGKPIPSGCS
jgi:hypothetical protein